jgi:N-acetylneuraminate synthase
MKNPAIMKIANRLIGEDYPPLVIAEIGINHNGSLELAKELVDSAIRAGAEIIKHQTHIVEDEMAGAAKNVIPGNADISIYEIMEKSALNEEDETALKEYIEEQGAIFISTPFSRAAANRLERMGVQAYKIGSGECNNYPLIEHIARFGKPIILSTGMNTIDSIKPSVEIFRKYKIPYALLHCTNLYPTPDKLIRLGGISKLKAAFPDAHVGLSDHSIDNVACIAATALGAVVLERHFTDTMDREGPDIVCSMDEEACANLIKNSKRVWEMSGGEKEPAAEEQVTIDFAYASVVTIKNIDKGERFTEDNLWVKRPGTGEFLAKDYKRLLGKIAATDISSDMLLQESDVEGWNE